MLVTIFIACNAEVDAFLADKMATHKGVALSLRIPAEGRTGLETVRSGVRQHRMELKDLHEDLKRRFRKALSKKSSDPYSHEWSDYFQVHFVDIRRKEWDDLLFYVVRDNKTVTVETYRRESRTLPVARASHVNWEESTYLNYLMHNFTFNATTAICYNHPTPVGKSRLDVVTSKQVRVYPSVTQHSMSKRDEDSVVCYPKIVFAIDSFSDLFEDMVAASTEHFFAMEVTALNKELGLEHVVFGGKVPYANMKKVHENKAKGPLFRQMKKQVGSWLHRAQNQYAVSDVEFLRMTGPNGSGCAEVAVSITAPEPVILFNNPMLHSSPDDAGPLHPRDATEAAVAKQPEPSPPLQPGTFPVTAKLASVELSWDALMNDIMYRCKSPDLPLPLTD